jgi:hypothetical protein
MRSTVLFKCYVWCYLLFANAEHCTSYYWFAFGPLAGKIPNTRRFFSFNCFGAQHAGAPKSAKNLHKYRYVKFS